MFDLFQQHISDALAAVGLDEASFKTLLCTLLSFPFSGIYKRLPDRAYTLKNCYVIGVSMFYLFGILNLRSGLSTLLVASGGCYFITRYLRTDLMPWVNFLFLMSHLAYNHLYTQFFNTYDPTVVDITGAQMVLVMKLSAFGWNIHDGKAKSAPSEYTQTRAIKKHPNLLPYTGYVLFYPSLLTGPAFDFIDYDKFIHATLFDDVPEDKRPGKTRKRRIPKSGRQALKKVLQGLFWALVFIESPKYVSMDYMLSDKFVTEHNLFYRIVYLWALGVSYRLKYYCIWLISEGACILCGIGYNGYDQVTHSFKCNRVQNIDPWVFETGQNVRTCLEAWNMNTNKWLKHYVYTRIARKGKKPGFKSTLFTFATSAFWHGTRPGYYLTFVMGAFLQTLGRIYRRNIRPIFLEADGKTPKPSKKIYDVVSWVVTQLAFGYIVQPFMILDFGRSFQCWLTVYFYVPIVTAITLFLFKGPYKKQVVAYCQSLAPAKEAPVKDNKLNKEEIAAVQLGVEKALVKDTAPTLGLPPIDVLENATREDFEEDLRYFTEAWRSFKERRKAPEDDLDGLKDAYNNFKTEINEIFQSEKHEAKEKLA